MKYLFMLGFVFSSFWAWGQYKEPKTLVPSINPQVDRITLRRSKNFFFAPDSNDFFKDIQKNQLAIKLLKSDIGFRPSRMVIEGKNLVGKIKGKGITESNDVIFEDASALSAKVYNEPIIDAEIIFQNGTQYKLPRIEIIAPIVPSASNTRGFISLTACILVVFGAILFINFKKFSFFNSSDQIRSIISQQGLGGLVFRFCFMTLLIGLIFSSLVFHQIFDDRIYGRLSLGIMALVVTNVSLLLVFVYTIFKLQGESAQNSVMLLIASLTWTVVITLTPYFIQQQYAILSIGAWGFTAELLLFGMITWWGSYSIRRVKSIILSQMSPSNSIGIITEVTHNQVYHQPTHIPIKGINTEQYVQSKNQIEIFIRNNKLQDAFESLRILLTTYSLKDAHELNNKLLNLERHLSETTFLNDTSQLDEKTVSQRMSKITDGILAILNAIQKEGLKS